MITLRQARPIDAKAIQEVHRDSIQRIANAFYPVGVIDAWSAPLGAPETVRDHEEAIRAGSELVMVAEENEIIVGFGTIVPKTSELRAIYVGSSSKRLGIGTKILFALEALARKYGLKELRMHASLSAEAFYLARGFRELERKRHRLSNEAEMDCVVMQKALA